MAYDALRLRNVIQLIGLLSESFVCNWLLSIFNGVPPMSTVFHAALIVMALLQVHETHTALVSNPGANWTTDYAVRLSCFPSASTHDTVFYSTVTALERSGNASCPS